MTGAPTPPATPQPEAPWGKGATLGIMQPYFFPYLGYFQLIHATDHWIVFDTVQYIRHGWMNRNRILHPSEGWQYIIAPLRGAHREIRIRDVRIQDIRAIHQRIRGQLQHYKKRAPHFATTMDVVDACFENDPELLVDLCEQILHVCCHHLGLSWNMRRFSRMDLPLPRMDGPGDWAPAIAGRLGARRYVNAPGGRELFRRRDFTDQGVEPQLMAPVPVEYSQMRRPFIEELSILDVMMWNDAREVGRMLEEYRLDDL